MEVIMKKVYMVLAVLLVCASACFTADPVFGYWVSIDEETNKPTGAWRIWEEGGKLYGKMVSLVGYAADQKAVGAKGRGPYDGFPQSGNMEDMTVIGTTWIYDLEKKEEGVWHKGYIVDPNNGKRYKCKITFRKANGKKYKTDTLEMRGEIGAGIGRSQFWTATTEAEAFALK